jgi:hypothetical protein
MTSLDLATHNLRDAADELSRRYVAGDLSASEYRRQLAQLQVQAAQPDTPPEVPSTTRPRNPVTRTARSARAQRRETR